MNDPISDLSRWSAVFTLTILLSATLLVSTPVQQADATTGFTDFNGDGFEDLAIGVPNEAVGSVADAGAVNVIYGSSSGLSATAARADQIWTQNSVEIEESAAEGEGFGRSLATGDFNRDGRSDLAIGVPREGVGSVTGAGGINVIYGSSQGLKATGVAAGNGRADQFFSQNSADVEDAAEALDEFGYSLAAGDFNGDGYDDLAIGAAAEDVGSVSNAGAINVIYGSANGLSPTTIPDQFWTQGMLGLCCGETGEPEDAFGQTLAAGDFNNDGKDDLAVGTPGEDGVATNVGAVNIIYGSSSGLSAAAVLPAQQWAQGFGGIQDTGEANDQFGTSLADGDFNGDGFADLAVGVPTENGDEGTDVGWVHVMYGSASGLTSNGNQVIFQGPPEIEDFAEPFDGFGSALVTADFNGDSFDDLAIGVPGEDVGSVSGAGAFHVFYGTASRLSATSIPDQLWGQDSPNIKGIAENNDRFGSALAAGDFDDDGRSDLVVGVPEESLRDINDDEIFTVGSINVIYGTGTGLAAADNQVFHQNAASVEDNAESGDRFGWALASG